MLIAIKKKIYVILFFVGVNELATKATLKAKMLRHKEANEKSYENIYRKKNNYFYHQTSIKREWNKVEECLKEWKFGVIKNGKENWRKKNVSLVIKKIIIILGWKEKDFFCGWRSQF